MRLFFIFFCLCLLVACTPSDNQDKQKSAGLNKNEIVFVTHNGPTTYYVNGDNQFSGIEYDLATMFIKDYAPEYQIKFLLVNSISDVIPTLLKGKANIAAANLTITPLRQQLVQFAKPYQETQQQLIYNNEIDDKPKDLASISDKKIVVPAGTSFA